MNIVFDQVIREYILGGEKWVLGPLSFSVPQEDSLCILGPSGSGKSTLLHLLGAMDSITSGKILVEEKNISSFDEHQKNKYRKDEIGIIFQDFYLFPECTVAENVQMSIEISEPNLSNTEKKERTEKILEEVGLLAMKKIFPSQLSGGQRQRVAIARAIVKQPKILLADEPTGNLDAKTGEKILDLIFSLAQEYGMGVWCVTHDEKISQRCDQVIRIEDGKLKR